MKPKGKKPTTRGRKPSELKDAALEQAASAPRATHDWRAIVEQITDEPSRRVALMLELASLDEVEKEMRVQVLAGSSTAGRVWLGIKQQRAKILGLYALPPTPKPPPSPDSEIDVPDWTPLAEGAVSHGADADLNAALEAELQGQAQ